ncbi:MAG: hypothetical protein KTR30_05435 [Saprospiraceae bacterium]|nr:hypothetical protein [Saprospiraceae bacterium]
MRTLISICLCCMIVCNHGLIARQDFAPKDTILGSTSDQREFQMYVDSIEKYLYLNTNVVDQYFNSCKDILEKDIPIPDSSLFDYVIQEIYYAHVKDNALAAFQIMEVHEHMLEVEEVPQKLKNSFIYMKGFTSMTLGDLAFARAAFYELIDRGEQQRDSSQLVLGLFSLGQLLSDQKDFVGATQCFKRLLTFSDPYLPPGTFSLINFELSEVYSRDNQNEEALALIDSALVSLEAEKIFILKPDFLLLKGEIALEEKDYQLAWQLYEEANELSLKNQDPTNIRKSDLFKAQILSSEGKYAEALEMYESLIDLQDTTDLEEALDLYMEVHPIYKKSGEETKAYESLVRSNSLQMKIHTERKRRETEYLKIKYEGEKKENENKILAVQVARKISQNTLLYTLTTLFGLGVLILLIAFYQKRKFNQKLKAEVRNRTVELEYANTQLINTNHELDEFNRILSHDLKEPIRSLVGFSTLLKKRGMQGQEAKEYLGYIEKSGKQLYETLSAVSAFQNTTPLKIPKGEVIDISQVVENIILELRNKNPEKRINYSGLNLPIIHSSGPAIQRIFKELINNGIKFNQSAIPEIIVKYDKQEGSHCFEFQDNGIGIASEYQEQIFGMFKRLNGRNEYEGAGLGLNIAMKMAKRLNGDISILQSQENEGSTFQFRFPAEA